MGSSGPDTMVRCAPYICTVVSDPVEFLQRYYHHLTRCIRPQAFYTYLRTQKVLSMDDQEIIENTYITTYLKAGCLIDIISRKGEKAFVAFMEVVEYTYADLFRDITGRTARPAPPSFSPPGSLNRSLRKQPSTEVLQLMAQVTNTLSQEVAEKKHQLTELQKLVQRMTEERVTEEDQKNSIFNELESTKDKVEQLTTDKEHLIREVQKLREEKEQEKKRYQETLFQKDIYMEQCNQLRVHCENMGSKVQQLHAIQRSASCRRPASFAQNERLQLENQELRSQLLRYKSQSGVETAPNDQPDTMTLHWKAKCVELEEKLEELTFENGNLMETCSGLETRCKMLQETNSQWRASFEQCLAERDQNRKLYDEAESRCNDEKSRNENLTQECRQYMERYRQMAEMLENMNRELEEQRNYQCIHSSWCYQRERLKAIDTTRFRKFNALQKIGESKSENNLCRHADKNKSDLLTDKEKKSYKRNGSLPFLGAEPLVIFIPKDVEQPLYQQLKPNFDSCPITVITSEEEMTASIHNLEIIHYEDRTPEGGYHCILTNQLQQLQSHVLLTLPVNCILRMNRASIRPIVAVIKFTNKEGFHELSNEEEVLERNDVDYELILVDEELKKDLSSLSKFVLPKLKSLLSH